MHTCGRREWIRDCGSVSYRTHLFFRYWSGLIRLCIKTNRRREALELVVSLSDLKLIKDSQPWGMYKCSGKNINSPQQLNIRCSLLKFRELCVTSRQYLFVVFVYSYIINEGTMASWLVRSSPDRVVLVRALTGDIVPVAFLQDTLLSVHLSTQVYKWIPANLMLGGNPAMD